MFSQAEIEKIANEVTEEDILAELNRLHEAEMRMALIEQEQAAIHRRERYHHLDGETEMQVAPFFFHLWGRNPKYTYDCWDDKQFKKEVIRDNPEVRVVNHSRKCQVGYIPAKSRFHKSFG